MRVDSSVDVSGFPSGTVWAEAAEQAVLPFRWNHLRLVSHLIDGRKLCQMVKIIYIMYIWCFMV